ncbi:MAG: hypothetical protein ACU0BK_05860 [Shimia sp.]|uniref:hypothetical protein n=1 Tax=Shimia sp. TaxID=1954381 RepID=UPI00405943CC
MTVTQGKTKAVNLRIEEQFEGLLRQSVGGIRKGGPEFRKSLQELLDSLKAENPTPGEELQARLLDLERRILAVEQKCLVHSDGLDL